MQMSVNSSSFTLVTFKAAGHDNSEAERDFAGSASWIFK